MALVDNLVSYYKFDRDIFDSKGTNDGTSQFVSWIRSLNGLAAKFDNSLSRATIPNDTSLQLTGDLTIAFLIRPYDIGSPQYVLNKGTSNEYFIQLESNGDLTFTHGDGTATETFSLLDSSTYLTANERAHILIVRDSSNGRIYSYKNGQQILNTDYSTAVTSSTNDVQLSGSDTQFYEGEIDDLAFWSRPLESDEVGQIISSDQYQEYNSVDDMFEISDGYKQYSLVVEDGLSSAFWAQLVDKDRYLESEDVTLTQGGLLAEYYDGRDFDTLDTTRIDSTVDFDFGSAEPAGTNVGATEYSIRWTGYLLPEFSETYTLYVGSDDGTRLYIDGALLIDNWTDQAYNQESETIALEAGKYYEIEIEYYQGSGGAEVDFYWESASQAYEVVPSTALYYIDSSINYNVYSTITDWQSNRVRDLAARGEKEILDIRGDWTSPSAQINLSGWTTDIDRDYFVVIQTIGLSKPEHVYTTSSLPSHFRIESSNATDPAITINGFSIELKNIQAESESQVVDVSTSENDVVRILYSELRNTNKTASVIYANQNEGRLEVVSSVVLNGQSGILASTNNTGTVYIIDSTIAECFNGIKSNDTNVQPTSCAVFNNTDDFVDTFPENWPRFCASDDNDVGVQGVDISPNANEPDDWNDAFVDYANGDFRVQSDTSVLYDAGEPNAGGNYYSIRGIPYLDVGGAPRVRRDIGALSFTDWWDYRYSERIQINVPASEIPVDLTGFPLYIDLSKVNSLSGFWRRADANGRDLITTNNIRLRVPQELVFVDTLTKDGEIWAKVDLSSTSDSVFYVYYNFNPLDEEPDDIDVADNNNIHGQFQVWTDYVAVWHLQDLSIEDSTGNGYDGTVRGTPSVVADGRFGYSIEWNENGSFEQQSADVGNIQTDATWTGITIESWFRKDTTGDERMICKSESGSFVGDHIFALHSQDRGNFISSRISTDTTDAFTFDGDETFTTGTWQFAAATWSASDELLNLYVNGQPDNSTTLTGNHVRTSSQQVEIANVDNSTLDRFWEGGLDEIRLAKTRFPSRQERLEAQYNNQTSEAFGDAAPQPQTNPVLPPAEDVDVQGSWTAFSTSGTQLTIDVDIPELTGKLALVVGTSNESSDTDQVSSITLGGVSGTFADLARQGAGFSNTAEVWYFLDGDLPTTPGTYTLTINFTNNGLESFAATAVLYNTILQQAPETYTSNAASSTAISNNVTIDTTNVNANIAFEVTSAGDANNSEPGSAQTEISDVTFGTAAIATSQAQYGENATETVSRTMQANTNRLAQVVAVWKSGETAEITIIPNGGITASGSAGPAIIFFNILYTGSGTATFAGSGDDPVLGYIQTPSGGLSAEGAAERDFELNAITPSGGLSTEGAAESTIEFSRTGSGQMVLTGRPEYFPEYSWLANPEVFEIVGEVTGILGVIYVAEPAASALTGEADYFPEFSYAADAIAFNLAGDVAIDSVKLIFEVDIAPALALSGGDYFIEFARKGSGGFVIQGSVPEFDTVDLAAIFGTGGATIAGTTDENEAHLPATTSTATTGLSGTAFPYTLDYEYTPVITEIRRPTLFGEVKGIATANALFIYNASGQAFFTFSSATTAFSQTVGYIPSGGLRLKSVYPSKHSYYPQYEYTASGGTVTLFGGLSFATIRAIDPTGGITLSGSVVADEVRWNYRYSAVGKIKFTRGFGVKPSLHLAFISIPDPWVLEVSGSASVDDFKKTYEYTGSGIIIVRQASVHRYVAKGGLIVAGAIDAADEVKYDYIYSPSGKIRIARTVTSRELAIVVKLKAKPIEITGSWRSKVSYSYTASGKIYFQDPDSSFSYTSPFRLRVRTSGSADVLVNEFAILTDGFIRIKGSAPVTVKMPDIYMASGTITTNGTAEVLYDGATYLFVAAGSKRLTGRAEYTLRLAKLYFGSGKTSISGFASTEIDNIEAIYTASGQLQFFGTAHYYLLEENTHKASGRALIGGHADAELSNATYNYVASGIGRFKQFIGDYSLELPKSYSGFGLVRIYSETIEYELSNAIYVYSTSDTRRVRYAGKASVRVSLPKRYTASGRATFNGKAIAELASVAVEETGEGRIQLSGTSLKQFQPFDTTFSYIASEGIAIAGIANTEYTRDYSWRTAWPYFFTLSGSLNAELGYRYSGSGQITISGKADLTFRYDVTGSISTAGSAEHLHTPAFKYTGSGRLKFVRFVLADYEATWFIRANGKAKTKGSAKAKAVYSHAPYIAESIPATTSGAAAYTHSSLYEYIADGAAIFAGAGETEVEVVKLYEASGQVNITGTALYEYTPNYGYVFTGGIDVAGAGEAIGRRSFSYVASGKIETDGSGLTTRRTVVFKLRNGSEADAYMEPRSVRQPLAGRVFKYDLTR